MDTKTLRNFRNSAVFYFSGVIIGMLFIGYKLLSMIKQISIYTMKYKIDKS